MADGDDRRAVPVAMGSPRFVSTDVDRVRCTHAWFPANADLEPHIHERATFGVMIAGGFGGPDARAVAAAADRPDQSFPQRTDRAAGTTPGS